MIVTRRCAIFIIGLIHVRALCSGKRALKHRKACTRWPCSVHWFIGIYRCSKWRKPLILKEKSLVPVRALTWLLIRVSRVRAPDRALKVLFLRTWFVGTVLFFMSFKTPVFLRLSEVWYPVCPVWFYPISKMLEKLWHLFFWIKLKH